MRTRALATALIIMCTCVLRAAQEPTQSSPSLAFEVATIKADDDPTRGTFIDCHGTDTRLTRVISTVPLGRCIAKHLTAVALLAKTFDEPVTVVFSRGPQWLDKDTFAIEAKASQPVSEKDLREMLQALLAARLKLQWHRESREEQGYALVIAKGGFKT